MGSEMCIRDSLHLVVLHVPALQCPLWQNHCPRQRLVQAALSHIHIYMCDGVPSFQGTVLHQLQSTGKQSNRVQASFHFQPQRKVFGANPESTDSEFLDSAPKKIYKKSQIASTPKGMGLSTPRSWGGGAGQGHPNQSGSARGTTATPADLSAT